MSDVTVEELLDDWVHDEPTIREQIVEHLLWCPASKVAEFLSAGIIDGRIDTAKHEHEEIIDGLKGREREIDEAWRPMPGNSPDILNN